MAKVTLSRTTFENLVKHLVEIEEGKNVLLEQYFLKPSRERNQIKKLIEDYIKRLDQLIRTAKKAETSDNCVPFVTICSEVKVEDLSDKKIYSYHIVSPFSEHKKDDDISYLSPVGSSLLLKKVGDEVEIKAPGGNFIYKIKSIELSGDIE